jgi:hypothetical protein
MTGDRNLNDVPLLKRAKVARRLIADLDLDERFAMLEAVVWPSGPPPALEPGHNTRPVEDATGQFLIEGAA